MFATMKAKKAMKGKSSVRKVKAKKTRKAMNSFVRRKWDENGREYTKVLQLSADIVDV